MSFKIDDKKKYLKSTLKYWKILENKVSKTQNKVNTNIQSNKKTKKYE